MITVPVVLVLGLALGGAGSHDPSPTPSSDAVLPPVTVTAPPNPTDAVTSACAQVISGLPLVLDGQNLRRTQSTPATGLVQAWGEPAIVLRCGVARPSQLAPSLSQQFTIVNGVGWIREPTADGNLWTIIDRSVYVDVAVPSGYQQPPLGPISDAVKKALPRAVCSTDISSAPLKDLCTRRA